MKAISLLACFSISLHLAMTPVVSLAATNDPAADPAAAPKAAEPAKPAKAPANELALGSDAIYKSSLAALTMLFVVAVLVESALNPIFNWRVFLTYFSSTGVKTII